MKKLAKKVLSLILAGILAATILIPAFAYQANTADVVGFSVSFDDTDYKLIKDIVIDLSNSFSNTYTTFCGNDSFHYRLSNEDGVIFERALYYTDFTLGTNAGGGIQIKIAPITVKVYSYNKEVTLTIDKGAFVSDVGQLSPELSVSFQLKDFSKLTYSERLNENIKGFFLAVFATIVLLPFVSFWYGPDFLARMREILANR